MFRAGAKETESMKEPLSYKDAGVDIEAADTLVDYIRPLAKTTFRKEVVTDIGGFGGIVAIDKERFPDPLLVSSTDGVGTKLRIALEMDKHETIGQDLVAMCVNDVIVSGAEPLFFLDYFATGRLDLEQAKKVLRGVAEGCRIAECALIGGETAEMPSFYPGGEYELAGFCVGIVNRDKILNGREILPGDILLGLESNGLHSNGYSLVRKLFSKERGYRLNDTLEGFSLPLGEELLRPTKIYVKPVLGLLGQIPAKGFAHITGGGLIENIPRILPSNCRAVLHGSQWPVPKIFHLIEKEGNIPLPEMLRTFNYGIGMIIVLDKEHAAAAMTFFQNEGERCFKIGEITSRGNGDEPVGWTN